MALFLSFPVFALDFNDYYSVFGDSADIFADPNTGLTSFPILSCPMGGKYEGMGTAYTAFAQDSGALAANPAATSLLESTELSLFHNNWISDSSIEGVIYTIRFNDLGIGFGGKFLYLPFSEYNSWGETQAKGYPAETIATMNISYNFFSSFYFYGFSLGMNLKIAYRHIPEVFYEDQSAITAMVDIGTLTRFNLLKFYTARAKNFSLGAVIKNLGFPAIDDPLPTEITAGIAYSPFRPFTVTFDFSYPCNPYIPQEQWEQWHMAGGMDIVFTDFFSIQSGFKFKGGYPGISMGSTIDLENISFVVNYTLDLTTQVKSFDRFSVEAKLTLGDEGRYSLKSRVDELYIVGLESYAQGDLAAAIRYWEAALELDPSFQPARENLETAKMALTLQEQMADLNKVE